MRPPVSAANVTKPYLRNTSLLKRDSNEILRSGKNTRSKAGLSNCGAVGPMGLLNRLLDQMLDQVLDQVLDR